MTNEWFEIAWINFVKAILHGQYVDDEGKEQTLEIVLNQDQIEAVWDMNERHEQAMNKLLRSFVND